MEAIRSDVGVVQPNKGRKVMKHLANAGVTTAGLTATGVGAARALERLELANIHASDFRGKDTLDNRYLNFFSRIGNKLIPEKSFFHEKLSYKIFGLNEPKNEIFVNSRMNYAKGRIALLLGAGVLATSILGAGFYKAGKINSEGK